MTRKHQALFLDRDGVINSDKGYVYRPDQFEFIEGIFDLCSKAMELNYLIIIITNQAGVGRGYYTEQQFHNLTRWMCQEFRAQDVYIDQVYFCPYHATHGIGEYKRESIFRKPGPGMILQAAKEFDVNLEKSVLVGDKETDILAGIAAGVGCNLLYYNVSHEEVSIETTSTCIVSNLTQVNDFLIT
jgi:D-glycero-D-manno-heptose 1,7-bisphosphate phosphatase